MEKEYYNSRELFEDTWQYGSTSQKKKLLRAVGHSETFAVTKSPQELIDRGGGFAAHSLGRVFDKWVEKNPGKKIRW